MILKVSPTRMELLRLRQRLTLARRGHKLLKDKQEELMRQFMLLIRETKALRQRLDEELAAAQQTFLQAQMDTAPADMRETLLLQPVQTTVETSVRLIMGLRVPQFAAHVTDDSFAYSFPTTTGDLDRALMAYRELIPKLTELAQQEKTVQMLADELEKTRRRVNALEYIFIPTLEDTIKYIASRLSEAELSTQVRLLKIKEIVEAH